MLRAPEFVVRGVNRVHQSLGVASADEQSFRGNVGLERDVQRAAVSAGAAC